MMRMGRTKRRERGHFLIAYRVSRGVDRTGKGEEENQRKQQIHVLTFIFIVLAG
jgi:hypothetical protein